MAKLIQAVVLYNGLTNEYVGDKLNTITINCERLNAYTPRPVWLQRWLAPGDGTLKISQPTFEVNSAEILAYGTNLIQGYWIEQDGFGVMIDIASASTLTDACNGCCDDAVTNPLTRFYTNGVPAFADPTNTTYCIARVDDGSPTAHYDASLAYANQGIRGFIMRSHASGISYYTVTSYAPIVAIGTDTVIAGACAKQ